MPNLKRRLKKQQRLSDHRAKRRAGDRRVAIDCLRWHGKVGIPVDVYQAGVESDPDKQLTTWQLRNGISLSHGKSMESFRLANLAAASTAMGDKPRVNPLHFICESCGYAEGATAFKPEFRLLSGDTCNG